MSKQVLETFNTGEMVRHMATLFSDMKHVQEKKRSRSTACEDDDDDDDDDDDEDVDDDDDISTSNKE